MCDIYKPDCSCDGGFVVIICDYDSQHFAVLMLRKHVVTTWNLGLFEAAEDEVGILVAMEVEDAGVLLEVGVDLHRVVGAFFLVGTAVRM